MKQARPIAFAALLPGQPRSLLYRSDPDGTDRVVVPTGGKAAFYPIWSPSGQEIVFATTQEEGAPLFVVSADGKTPPRPVPKTPAYAWLASKSAPEIRLSDGRVVRWKAPKDKGLTTFEVADPRGTVRRRKIKPGKDYALFNEIGISGGLLSLEPLPPALNAVLGWQLAGGNREGKWRVGLKIDLTTGVGTYWGEYGYSGIAFSPEGEQFITCFNWISPTTGKEEHLLCSGETKRPQRLKRLVRASGLIIADWRGGLHTSPYARG